MSSSKHDLYLSPHYDDICFSLGNHVANQGKGTMLGIFSRSNHIYNTGCITTGRFEEFSPETKIITASAIRGAEDQRFVKSVGLTVSYCNLDESPLRDRKTFDPTFAIEDTCRFSTTIVKHIRDLFPRDGEQCPNLYCPLGIGGHIDHLIVRNTILENLEELQEKYTMCFYEELPYASKSRARLKGLWDFFIHLGPRMLHHKILPVHDSTRKIAMLEIYSNQILDLLPLEDYTPAGTRGQQMHEAIWMI